MLNRPSVLTIIRKDSASFSRIREVENVWVMQAEKEIKVVRGLCSILHFANEKKLHSAF